MDNKPRRPALPLKFLTALAQTAFWLVFSGWIILGAAWATLHLWIVPRIGEMRPWLEERASHALGMPVLIGTIEAHSDSVLPSFALGGIQLQDASGRVVLQLPKVTVSVSPRSLWHFSFEQVAVEAPELEVRRDLEGRLWVAGMEIPAQSGSGSDAADWVFSQTEWVVTHGQIRWLDERGEMPELELRDVALRLHNHHGVHELRLDATPPQSLGGRVSVQAHMRQPLLFARPGQWKRWQGQIYATFGEVDWARLSRYVALPVDTAGGHGAVRLWADVAQGELLGVTADVALMDLDLRLQAGLPSLELSRLRGRLTAQRTSGRFSIATQGLEFQTRDALVWSGGDGHVSWTDAAGNTPAQGEVGLDGADLTALAALLQRLPLAHDLQQTVALYDPHGRVDRFLARWKGPWNAPASYEAQGRVSALEWSARPQWQALATEAVPGELGSPGVKGLSSEFELTQDGGSASLQIEQGHVELPGVFAEPRLGLDHFSGQLNWHLAADQIRVQLDNVRFANPDAEGDFNLRWQTGSKSAKRFPGVLDLQGSVSRADAAAVWRYLPLAIPDSVRDYLHRSLVSGQGQAGRFRVRGALADFPFVDPRTGEFRISAKANAVRYAYIPQALQSPGEKPWPALTDLDGDLLVDRSSLTLRNVSGKIEGVTQARLLRGQATIPDLIHDAHVLVEVQAQGALDPLLRNVVAGSPLNDLTGGLFDGVHASGQTDVQLALNIPVLKPEQTSVQGRVQLANNDLQWSPDLPPVGRARGTVHFSDHGFALSGVQARLLGGDVRAEGGTINVPGAPATSAPRLKVQGTLNAAGLRQAWPQGPWGQIAARLSGATSYGAEFYLRNGQPVFSLNSSLQGLAFDLPAPLGKSADLAMPVRIQITGFADEAEPRSGSFLQHAPERDQIRIELDRVLAANYLRQRDHGKYRVLNGALALGPQALNYLMLPVSGVAANVQLDSLDLDAWQKLVAGDGSTKTTSSADAAAPAVLEEYLPNYIRLNLQTVRSQGQTFTQLIAGASREGPVWRVNLEASELGGYLEYRLATRQGPGSVYARLAKLRLAKENAQGVDNLLDEPAQSMPALDVIIDDFELKGTRLGRLEVNAVNLGTARREGGNREWKLNKLRITLPEADFNASGNWAVRPEFSGNPNGLGVPLLLDRRRRDPRRTTLTIQLDVRDAGALLTRFAMPGLLRSGKGSLQGQIGWDGSPAEMDYPSMGGTLNVNIENGQFLKADPGLAKLVGVLSLQSLPRRLTLDFRDVFSDGFAFDYLRGDIRIEQGVASTNNLQMKGVSAAVMMSGQADLAHETQNLHVVVVPEINAGTASLLATWINPTVGLGTFLAQLLLRGPAIAAATQEFEVTGSWSDPQMKKVDHVVRPESTDADKSQGGKTP